VTADVKLVVALQFLNKCMHGNVNPPILLSVDHLVVSIVKIHVLACLHIMCCAALRNAAVRSEGPPVLRVLRLIVLRHLFTLNNAINRYSTEL